MSARGAWVPLSPWHMLGSGDTVFLLLAEPPPAKMQGLAQHLKLSIEVTRKLLERAFLPR